MWTVFGRRLDEVGNRFASIRTDLREVPERVRTSVRLSQQSGMLWSLTTPGILELGHVVLREPREFWVLIQVARAE